MSEEGALLPAVIDTAVVRPGDTLVLVAPDMTREWADDVKAECEERLPGVRLAIVLCATQALVYRPDCCGHVVEGLIANTAPLFCTKPAGHQYAHGDDSGCQWTEAAPDAEEAA